MDRVGDMKWKIMNDIYAVKAKKTHLCFWSPNPPNFFQARFLTLHFFSRKLPVSITISFFFYKFVMAAHLLAARSLCSLLFHVVNIIVKSSFSNNLERKM